MAARRKLLLVAGAGSSVELGMPSVWNVGELLRAESQEFFSLADKPSDNLYGHLHEAMAAYWNDGLPPGQEPKLPNFEDILYVISTIAATYRAGIYTSGIGAFLKPPTLPDIVQFGKKQRVNDNVVRHLGQHLVDSLLAGFRSQCSNSAVGKVKEHAYFKTFFQALSSEFEIAVVTLNYDNLIYNALPTLETGFDVAGDGHFSPLRIVNRATWPCMLHLHGSVHFDMRVVNLDLHKIFWEPKLSECQQNSFGRSLRYSIEGNQYPTSSIIAGYGKTFQILKSPFRTYYSELERLVHESDAALFAGYGFGDTHLNAAFSDYFKNRDRPVVVVDFASDDTLTAGSGYYEGSRSAKQAMSLFDVAPYRLSWLGSTVPDTVAELKQGKAFERCRDPGCRLSLWYGGMIEACQHTSEVIAELNQIASSYQP